MAHSTGQALLRLVRCLRGVRDLHDNDVAKESVFASFADFILGRLKCLPGDMSATTKPFSQLATVAQMDLRNVRCER